MNTDIEVHGADEAESARLAVSLRDWLRDELPTSDVTLVKADQTTMDAGSIVSVILESSAITILAAGVADWLRRRPHSTVKVDGLEVTGLTPGGAERIAHRLTHRSSSK